MGRTTFPVVETYSLPTFVVLCQDRRGVLAAMQAGGGKIAERQPLLQVHVNHHFQPSVQPYQNSNANAMAQPAAQWSAQPIQQQPMQQKPPPPRFDPYTGQPIAAPVMRYDPYTGQPIGPPAGSAIVSDSEA